MTLEDLKKIGFQYWHTADQLKDHIYRRSRDFFQAGDAMRDGLNSISLVQSYQKKLRADFLAGLGGLPEGPSPEKEAPGPSFRAAGAAVPTHCVCTGRHAYPGFEVENLIFQSRPHVYVTTNLYLPTPRVEKRPAVLFLCGHLTPAKQADEYRLACRIFAEAGFVVLAQDPLGQGERLSYARAGDKEPRVRPGVHDHDRQGVPCRLLGETLGRYFLHDAMRSLDLLLEREEVDGTRIGVTGNSGGAVQTCLLMLADPRVAAAAPITFLTSREALQQTGMGQDAEQVWPGFTANGYDHEDVLLAMAPRPVLVAAAQWDYFPIAGTRRTVERARRAWQLFGCEHALHLNEYPCRHHYTPEMAADVARFFATHFGFSPSAGAHPTEGVPAAALQCTQSGQVLIDFADARAVHQEVAEVHRARGRIHDPARLGAWLRERVKHGRQACDLDPVYWHEGEIDDIQVSLVFWWSQPNLINNGAFFRHKTRGAGSVAIGLWDGGTRESATHRLWIEQAVEKHAAAFVVDLSGTGMVESANLNWRQKDGFCGTYAKLSDDLDWIGDSLAALRVYDVLRAAEVARLQPDSDGSLHIYAEGRAGIYGRLAAALMENVRGVEVGPGLAVFEDVVRNPDYDARDVKSIVVPGFLAFGDIDDLSGLVATR